jgi:tetratricopeptide (TPR) repeat protein
VTHKTGHRFLLAPLSLALLVLALLLLLRPPDQAYRAYLRQGDADVAVGERTAAVVAYEQAAQLRPQASEPHLRLAELYLAWGRAAEALDALAQAERLGALSDEGERLARLRAQAHAAQADWPAVVEQAHRLLTFVEDDRDARLLLAHAYVELRAWDAASAEYESLLASDPTDTLAHERLGALGYGHDPAAIQHLFSAQTSLSTLLLEALESPGVEDPAYASAVFGQVLFEAEEWALASRQFERALSYSPGYSDAHAYLGYALDQMRYPDEAYPHLALAVELAPDSAVPHLFLGLHYEQRGDSAAARAEYEAAYDIDPENPATSVAIGRVWTVEGRYETAEVWLTHAVSLAPDDPIVLEILTRFYLEHNIISEDRGITAASRLAELAPADARAHDLQGWAALQVGEYSVAEESLMRALSLDPSLASAHYHLGLLWQLRGDSGRAEESFERALDLDTTGRLAPLVERALEIEP